MQSKFEQLGPELNTIVNSKLAQDTGNDKPDQTKVTNPSKSKEVTGHLILTIHTCSWASNLVKDKDNCLVSNQEGLVQVRLLWDKRHRTHIVRKNTLKLATISSLLFIRPILNKIQPFKNSKIY